MKLNHNVIDYSFKTKRVKGSNSLCFVVSGSLVPVTVVLSQYKSWTRVLGPKAGLLYGNY